MINQVIIAGHLSEDPFTDADGLVLKVDVARPARGWSNGAEAPAIVTARAMGERRVAAMQKCFSKGRELLIHGHLQEGRGGLCVVVDSFEFMEHGLSTRALAADDGRSVARPAATPLKPATKPVTKPARVGAAA